MRWSQERSNLLLPGFNRPLHHQSFRTMGALEDRAIEGATPYAGIHVNGEGTLVLRIEHTEPAAGIEPAYKAYETSLNPRTPRSAMG